MGIKMNIIKPILLLSIIPIGIVSGYTLGTAYYPDGCCSELGAWLILAYILITMISPIVVFFWKIDEVLK